MAEFANEKGECWASQETLAEMCDMDVRTVRAQLAHLEDDLGLIERAQRRRKDGTRTSDGIRLLAPAERLKPPNKQPENPSGRVDAAKVCREYEVWHRDNAGKTRNFRGRLRNFFEKSSAGKDRSGANGRGSPKRSIAVIGATDADYNPEEYRFHE